MLAAEVGLTSAPVSIDTDVDRTVNQDSWIAWHPHAPVDEDVIVVGEAVFAIEPLSGESTIDAVAGSRAYAYPFSVSFSLCDVWRGATARWRYAASRPSSRRNRVDRGACNR